VLQGEGAIHNLASRDFVEPVIRVTNAEGVPIPNASVSFVLPEAGPGATFRGERFLVVSTAANGEATGVGLRPNKQAGSWEIRVSVSYQGAIERLTIPQINAAPATSTVTRSRRPLWLAGLLGAGAAAGVVLGTGATGGRSTTAGPTPAPTPAPPSPTGTVIRPGAGAIGPP
jgi:hypothetical protein